MLPEFFSLDVDNDDQYGRNDAECRRSKRRYQENQVRSEMYWQIVKGHVLTKLTQYNRVSGQHSIVPSVNVRRYRILVFKEAKTDGLSVE